MTPHALLSAVSRPSTSLSWPIRLTRTAVLLIGEASTVRLTSRVTRCVLPARNVPDDAPAGIRLVGVRSLEEALERLAD